MKKAKRRIEIDPRKLEMEIRTVLIPLGIQICVA